MSMDYANILYRLFRVTENQEREFQRPRRQYNTVPIDAEA